MFCLEFCSVTLNQHFDRKAVVRVPWIFINSSRPHGVFFSLLVGFSSLLLVKLYINFRFYIFQNNEVEYIKSSHITCVIKIYNILSSIKDKSAKLFMHVIENFSILTKYIHITRLISKKRDIIELKK